MDIEQQNSSADSTNRSSTEDEGNIEVGDILKEEQQNKSGIDQTTSAITDAAAAADSLAVNELPVEGGNNVLGDNAGDITSISENATIIVEEETIGNNSGPVYNDEATDSGVAGAEQSTTVSPMEQKLVQQLNDQLDSDIGQLKQEADQLFTVDNGDTYAEGEIVAAPPSGSARQLLHSPTPDDREGFKFNNVADQSVDPEAEAVQLGTKLSRPGSGSLISKSQNQPVEPEVPRATSPTASNSQLLASSKPPTATSVGQSRPGTVSGSSGSRMMGYNPSKPSTATSEISGGRRQQQLQQSSSTAAPVAVRFIDRQAVMVDITQVFGRLQGMAKRLDKLETCLSEYFRKRNSDNGGNSNGETASTDNQQQQQKAKIDEQTNDDNNSNSNNNNKSICNKDGNDSTGDKASGELELRYRSSLFSFRDNLQRLDSMRDEHTKAVTQYQATLETKRQAAEEVYENFIRHRHRVIVAAEYSKTGKPIPAKVIDQWESMDQKRDSEISKAVLENIKLRNRVRRSEFQLKEREELGDGLHLIDFEQLKIENQTFLEKIEERNEEVEKLRKKITVMVQVLTHVKEKLEFIRSENSELQNDLSAIDQEISEHRDNLPAMKSKRDRLRKENQDIRSQSGLLGHKHLLKDLELKMDASVGIQSKLHELKERYPKLDAQAMQLRRRLVKISAAMKEPK